MHQAGGVISLIQSIFVHLEEIPAFPVRDVGRAGAGGAFIRGGHRLHLPALGPALRKSPEVSVFPLKGCAAFPAPAQKGASASVHEGKGPSYS